MNEWNFQIGDRLTRSVWRPDEYVVVEAIGDLVFYDTNGKQYYKNYAESRWVKIEN